MGLISRGQPSLGSQPPTQPMHGGGGMPAANPTQLCACVGDSIIKVYSWKKSSTKKLCLFFLFLAYLLFFLLALARLLYPSFSRRSTSRLPAMATTSVSSSTVSSAPNSSSTTSSTTTTSTTPSPSINPAALQFLGFLVRNILRTELAGGSPPSSTPSSSTPGVSSAVAPVFLTPVSTSFPASTPASAHPTLHPAGISSGTFTHAQIPWPFGGR